MSKVVAENALKGDTTNQIIGTLVKTAALKGALSVK